MSDLTPNLVLGIDPGRVKAGLALVDATGSVIWRAIVPAGELRARLETVFEANEVTRIALGDSTASAETAALLKEILAAKNLDLRVEMVDERDSTLQARAVYFEHHPPRGWRRLVPLSLQNPPEPVDDFAAVVLTRRLDELP